MATYGDVRGFVSEVCVATLKGQNLKLGLRIQALRRQVASDLGETVEPVGLLVNVPNGHELSYKAEKMFQELVRELEIQKLKKCYGVE